MAACVAKLKSDVQEVQEKMANGTRSKCVCALHWPPGVQTKLRCNRPFPAVPPFIFSSHIPKSVFYTPPKPPRPTTLSSSEVRNRGVDQLEEHNKQFSFSATAPSDFLPRFTSILRKLGKIAVADNEKDIVLVSHGVKDQYLITLSFLHLSKIRLALQRMSNLNSFINLNKSPCPTHSHQDAESIQ